MVSLLWCSGENQMYIVKSMVGGRGGNEGKNEDSCCGLGEAIVTRACR